MSRNVVIYLSTLYKQAKTEIMVPVTNIAFYEHRPGTNFITVHTKCGEKFPVQTDDKRMAKFFKELKAANHTFVEI